MAGWTTARIARGSLDGIETGVGQLIRDAPLETREVELAGAQIRVPTEAEILRIKAVLILRRNATRDYLDFVALAGLLKPDAVTEALESFDRLYPQPNGESALQQLQIQLANPLPYDLEGMNLAEYKYLDPRLHGWDAVKAASIECAELIFDRVIGRDEEQAPPVAPARDRPSGPS